jgi:acetyl esterase/lipase
MRSPSLPLGCLRALAAVAVANGLCLQAAPPAVPAPAETLPASSPYGEAVVRRNIPYGAADLPHQNLDLYLPEKKSAQPFPFVFWIHGGAWKEGSKEWDNVKYLVRYGYAIATVDYRSSDRAPFPAQIQDCNAALNFVLAHARDYGIDPNKCVIGGASAGGHLALLLGMARHQSRFGANPRVKPLAILDFFGPADLTNMMGDLKSIHSDRGIRLLLDAGSSLLGAPIEKSRAKARKASPITYVSPGNPPILIVHGRKDDLVPVAQSERLHAALDRMGVRNRLILVDAAGHDGPLFSTPEIEAKVVAWLNQIQPLSQ